MNRTFRFFAITGAWVLTLGATFSFAQQDNVAIKRTAGDFYDITISGERNGDFAEIQMVRTEPTDGDSAINSWGVLTPPWLFMRTWSRAGT